MSSWSKTNPLDIWPVVSLGRIGSLSKEEAHFLVAVPGRIGPGNYLEIGIDRAKSTLCIADGIRVAGIGGHLVAVDAFDLEDRMRRDSDEDVSGKMGASFIVKGRFEEIKEVFKERGLADYATIIRSYSVDAAERYRDTEFVFAFIDGDHSYEGCKSDFNAWSPLIKSGGWMAFHDVDQPAVKQVIDESGWEVVEIAHRIGVIKKP